jgi:hypothetical protein
MGLRYRKGITREPRDTESGHAWFGGGPLEKYPYGQLAGGLSYRTSGLERGKGCKALPIATDCRDGQINT